MCFYSEQCDPQPANFSHVYIDLAWLIFTSPNYYSDNLFINVKVDPPPPLIETT